MENVAVIIRLSVEPAIGTDLQPFFPNVFFAARNKFQRCLVQTDYYRWWNLVLIDFLYNIAQVDCFYICFQFFQNLNFSSSR